MIIYFAFALGLVVGIAFNEWRNSWMFSKDPSIHVIVRKFEYDSQQMMAYNTAREAAEHNTDKFKLLKLKYTGNVMFDNRGIYMKYKSLHGHTIKFNYDMARFEIVDPPKANEL